MAAKKKSAAKKAAQPKPRKDGKDAKDPKSPGDKADSETLLPLEPAEAAAPTPLAKKRAAAPRSRKPAPLSPALPPPPSVTEPDDLLPADELPLSPNLKITRNRTAAAKLTLLQKSPAATQPVPPPASPAADLPPAAADVLPPAADSPPSAPVSPHSGQDLPPPAPAELLSVADSPNFAPATPCPAPSPPLPMEYPGLSEAQRPASGERKSADGEYLRKKAEHQRQTRAPEALKVSPASENLLPTSKNVLLTSENVLLTSENVPLTSKSLLPTNENFPPLTESAPASADTLLTSTEITPTSTECAPEKARLASEADGSAPREAAGSQTAAITASPAPAGTGLLRAIAAGNATGTSTHSASPPLPLPPSPTPLPAPTPLPSLTTSANEQLHLSRRAAWLGIAAFLALLVLPPLIHDLRLLFSAPSQLPVARFFTALTGSERPSTPVAQRLRLFEQELARASFTEGPRTATQQTMLALLERGNPRVIPGADDGSGKRWLFLRAEVQALTGWGPLREEPRGVASDPDTRTWQPPVPVILDFAAKLKERGVQLWLMPVPMKAALFPDKLTGQPAEAPLRHPDEAELYRRLTEGGVRVLDLTDDFWQARSAAEAGKIEPLYLRTDTHWSSQAVQLAASRAGLEIAAEAQRAGWAGLPDSPGQLPEFALAPPLPGDLVDLLGAGPGGTAFETSPAIARCLAADGTPLRPVRESPVLVLGDSNVNIFDDPSLGFAPESLPPGQRISAGFAQHLAAQLTSAMNIAGVDVHAINGKGTTGVREEFFRRGETAVRGKKIVLWVLAARNLLLNRRDAAAADVEWRMVEVSPDPAPASASPAPDAAAPPAVIEAEVVDKSDLIAPESANYADSLYTVRYRVKRTLSGTAPAADGAEIVAVHWNFKKRALQPARAVEAGKLYRLQLAPWPRPDMESLNLEDKFDDIAQRWWGETPEGL